MVGVGFLVGGDVVVKYGDILLCWIEVVGVVQGCVGVFVYDCFGVCFLVVDQCVDYCVVLYVGEVEMVEFLFEIVVIYCQGVY